MAELLIEKIKNNKIKRKWLKTKIHTLFYNIDSAVQNTWHIVFQWPTNSSKKNMESNKRKNLVQTNNSNNNNNVRYKWIKQFKPKDQTMNKLAKKEPQEWIKKSVADSAIILDKKPSKPDVGDLLKSK